jgi:hypothetical protein
MKDLLTALQKSWGANSRLFAFKEHFTACLDAILQKSARQLRQFAKFLETCNSNQ